MRKLFATFGKPNRQIVTQGWHFLVGEVIVPDEDEDHPRYLLDGVGCNTGRINEAIVRVAHNGIEVAGFEIEGKTVIPAGYRFFVETHGLGRKTYTAMNTLVL